MGSLSGGMGGSRDTKSGTQIQDPWAEQKPYLIDQFARGEEIYNGEQPQYYQGSTVAPVSDMTMAAGNSARWMSEDDRALNTASNSASGTANGNYLGANYGDPYYQSFASGDNEVSDLTRQTASGQYLNSNPYIDAMYGKAAKGVTQAYGDAMLGTQSAFAKSGRYGSGNQYDAEGRNQENLTKGLGDLATDVYGNNYASERGLMEAAQGRMGDMQLKGASGLSSNYTDERGNMISAAGLAPELEKSRYIGTDKQMEFGQYLDTHNQDVLNGEIDRWDFDQNAAQRALDTYMAAIKGDYGGTTQSRQVGTNFNWKLGGMLGSNG